MATRGSIAVGEWYHCYTRGVDRRTVFEDAQDWDRFLALLYIANGKKKLRLSDFRETSCARILANSAVDRGPHIAGIGAFTLMPNHTHFVLREIEEGGIARFMQRVFTAYTMYFNNKYARTGSLFSGTFKSKHLYDDAYLKRGTSYVLLNHWDLFDPERDNGLSSEITDKLITYPYSSLRDFVGLDSSYSKMIDQSLKEHYDRIPTLEEMMSDAISESGPPSHLHISHPRPHPQV